MKIPLLAAIAAAVAFAVPARAQDTVPPDTARRDTQSIPPAPKDTVRFGKRGAPADSARAAAPARGVLADSARAHGARPRRAPVPRAAPPSPRPRAGARVSARARPGPRVCAGGDVTLGTNLDTTWVFTSSGRLGRRVPAFPSPDSLLAPLKPLLVDADVALLNVESAIGEGPVGRRKCAPNSTACFAFRSPVAAAGALGRAAGGKPVVGNVTNNHARDAGDSGWYATMRHLEGAGARVTGADTLATPVVTAAGDTVAFLGFSPFIGPDSRNLAAVRRHVARAAARYRYVVVNAHLGAEGRGAQHTPNRTEIFLGEDRGNSVAFAHAAIDAGARVVFGHGPHVMRAAEWYRGGLIFYSLGNLLTYGPFTLSDPMNRGAIACADLGPAGGVLGAELRSTRQTPPGLARPDTAGVAATLVDALGAQDFPATAARVATNGVISPPGATGAPGATGPIGARPAPGRQVARPRAGEQRRPR
ncbi:MAG TPA: CapA family protein [Longimicrobium sp.]|nr:CapA family protein [Longimicrobium sp.]